MSAGCGQYNQAMRSFLAPLSALPWHQWLILADSDIIQGSFPFGHVPEKVKMTDRNQPDRQTADIHVQIDRQTDKQTDSPTDASSSWGSRNLIMKGKKGNSIVMAKALPNWRYTER